MKAGRVLLSIVGLFLVAALIYNLPPVHERLAWRVDQLWVQIKYAINPPEQAVFVPSQAETPSLPTATPTQPPTATPDANLLLTPTATSLPPTITPTPLPASGYIDGIEYEDQHARLNYCGPANLSMLLNFLGWDGNKDTVARAIKPGLEDKNVLPYEMADYAIEQGHQALVRVGGDEATLKRLITAGLPVLVEVGVFLTDLDGELSWMGHYRLISGYDDARQVWITQDSYFGPDHEIGYTEMTPGWRAFNYIYLVVYTPEQESTVQEALGPAWDETTARQIAAQRASEEIFSTTTSLDTYFAWFNRGTSLMLLQDYAGAAAAYDEAFLNVYPGIEEDRRPWRMMWYQTGPYWAYFYTGRYYDVIGLADTTLDAASKPVLEESFYWRALAKEALGDTYGATQDLREALRLNPAFGAAETQLDRINGGG